MKEDKAPGNELNETEIINAANRVTVINMLTEIRKRMEEYNENFSKEI